MKLWGVIYYLSTFLNYRLLFSYLKIYCVNLPVLQMKMKMQVAPMRINFAPALNVLVVRKADLRDEEVVNKNFAALMKEATSFLL